MVNCRLVIRPAKERDVPALAGLMGELGYPISLDDMRDRLAFVQSSRDDEILVAEIAGRVVGLVGIRIVEFVHRVGRQGQITALAVTSDCRRRGIGSALLGAMESYLRERGVLDVVVHTGNHRKDEAHRFYDGAGYDATGVRFTKKLA